jgi:hypothetical protein
MQKLCSNRGRKMIIRNYAKLKKLLTDFEDLLTKSELTTDEISDLGNKVDSLQEAIYNKESKDD